MPATLKSRFPEIVAELRPRISAAVKEGAEMISETATAKVPLGPGEVHLKEHMQVSRKGPAEYVVYNDAVAETGKRPVPYAMAVEFGHEGRSGSVGPHPFMVPAKEERESDVVDLVQAVLRGL